MNRKTSGLLGSNACPSFEELPDFGDFSSLVEFAYEAKEDGGGELTPTCNWCYLCEIVQSNYHVMRPSVVVRDIQGKTHPVVFYLGNNVVHNLQFPVGHTMALLYAHKKTFLDSTQGIRMENTNVKVFKCSLPVLLEESKKVGNDCCYSCGKSECPEGQKLLKCGKCTFALYCSKECQTSHWKRHKCLCGDIRLLDKLVKLVLSPYVEDGTFQTFEQLEPDQWIAPQPTVAETTTAPFILLFDIEEEVFFACFGEKSSWKCGFQSLSEDSSKAELKSILENPRLISVVIYQDGGTHWKEIVDFYKRGGFIVFYDMIGEFDAPKRFSKAFDLDWTYSAYTRHEYELTAVGKGILGGAITKQGYSKSNLLKVPEADRVLVPKHTYESVEALIQDEFYDDEGGSNGFMEKARARYAKIREDLNNQVPLALHKADHGGRIAYIGFVNSSHNIPKFVQAICMGVSTASLSTV